MKISLTCIVLACLVIWPIGCGSGQAPEEAEWYQSTATGKSLSDDQLLAKITRESNLFRLYEMKRSYIMGGGKSQAIVKALDARRDELVAARELSEAIPGKVDFVDWNIKKQDDGTHLVSAYLVVKNKPERDWRMKFIANVDEQHVDMLPPDSRAAKRLRHKINPETSTWEPGEHKILSQVFNFKAIPYEICGVFYLYPDGVYGETFKYGWFADPDLKPPAE